MLITQYTALCLYSDMEYLYVCVFGAIKYSNTKREREMRTQGQGDSDEKCKKMKSRFGDKNNNVKDVK